MKAQHIISTVILLGVVTGGALADRRLERAEVLQVFEKLTSRPQKTWIPAGTIEATHEEYRAPKVVDTGQVNERIKEKVREYQANPNKPEKAETLQKMKLDAIPFNIRSRLSNEYTMSSSVEVRFDGERFYWEIDVESRTDSVRPDAAMSSNIMAKHFNLNWNAKRIFTWDGEKYSTYSFPANSATIDLTESTPPTVNGPLTAALIPWGHGSLTYEKLAAADSSGTETDVEGKTQIQITIDNPDGSEVQVALDPAKDYAPISCLITRPGKPIVSNQYSNHVLISDRWVPTSIVTDKYDTISYRLLARDSWSLTRISDDIPEPGSFDIEYAPHALVEYSSTLTEKSLIYHRSQLIDSEQLLSERLSIAATEDTQTRNCATVALRYAAGQLGKDVPESQLEQLVSEPDGQTSLQAMRTFANSLGLYCRAITTDVQTLTMLSGCQAILHIPGTNHFVVLAGIDNDSVWTIDLTSKTFIRRTDLSFFDLDWTDGTALVISNEPIDLAGDYTDLDDIQLESIAGRAGYTCTRLLQREFIVYCFIGPVGCDAWYEKHPERLGCEAAESGICPDYWHVRLKEAPCLDDFWEPGDCETGTWDFYYMRACD